MRISAPNASLLLAVWLSACGWFAPSTTINGILADPGRFSGDDVWLNGRVVQSASILGRGAFQLDDGTGTVWVISDRGVPRKDARVRVRGTVHDGFDLGRVIELPDTMKNGLVLVAHDQDAVD